MKHFSSIPIVFLLAAILGCTPGIQKQSDSETQVTLVQSFPVGTDLFNPELPDAKDVWIKMIDESQTSIDIEQMYADGKAGEVLDQVMAALERASKRGVKIRFMLSKKMYSTNMVTTEAIKKIPNLELRAVDYAALTGGIQHSKFWIFDRKTIFVGSQNFDWKSLTHILETGVLIRDSLIAAQLQSIFDLDWTMADTGSKPNDLGTAPATPENASVYLVASPPLLNPKNIQSALDELTQLLRAAKSSVKITLLDFSSYRYGQAGEWRDLENELVATAKRGIKVELLVSHWNTEKPEIETIKRLSKVENIQVKIATIPDLPGGHIPYSRVNHGKFMIVDGSTLWVGTSNWSHGYFMATRGIEIVMKKKDVALQADAIFTRLWFEPYTEFVDINRDYPKPVK